MTHAPNPEEIPKATFEFYLDTIPDKDRASYGIGKTYGDKSVVAGTLAAPMLLTKVKFGDEYADRSAENPAGGYDETLTGMMDAYLKDGHTTDAADAILDRIMKYHYGAMRDSENVQRGLTRKATPEEYLLNIEEESPFIEESRGGMHWPLALASWRCFYQGCDLGDYENGCQNIREYDYKTFDYASDLGLHANNELIQYAAGVQDDILTHQEKEGEENYISISKPLFTFDQMVDGCEMTDNLTILERIKAAVQNGESGQILRFVLVEKNAPAGFLSNDEVKILDVNYDVMAGEARPALDEFAFMLFNSPQEADAFYAESDLHSPVVSPSAPSVSFTNRFMPPKEENPPVEPENPPAFPPGGIATPPFMPPEKEESAPERHESRHEKYIFGYPDGTVQPNGSMTRAEAAAVLTRLKGLKGDDAAPTFTDTPSNWYNRYINAVVEAGYMKGYPDGSFRPAEQITRAEVAQMILQFEESAEKTAPFSDTDGHWAKAAIDRAYASGNIDGYPDGSFRPDENITRAEAAKIMNRLFNRKVDERGLTPALKNPEDIAAFSDLEKSHWGYYEITEAANTHRFYRADKDALDEIWTRIE